MANQKYSSKDTSINSTKLPRIYGILPEFGLELDKMGLTLDYGCGKYFHSYGLPGNIKGYDPFNLPEEENLNNHYRRCILSNVLNVIAEPEIRREVLETVKSLADKVYITVYEGDGTGVGKETKKDCYQTNMKPGMYLGELKAVFNNVHRRKGVYVCF